MSDTPPSHHLAAVWFADLVGYTTLSETNEGEALRAVARFQATVRAVVEPHGGRVVKLMGDGALAEFPSTEQAVRSADALRAEFGRVAEAEGLGARELRIGVHVGDVAETGDGDLYGDGVNVASRIQAAADPGEVWVSEDVRRQLRQRPELRFVSRGEHTLKGLRTPLSLHAVGIGEKAPKDVSAAAPAAKHAGGLWTRRRAVSLLGAGILIALVAVGASTWFSGRGSDASAAETVLAVLPFENLSGDEATEPFVLGVHDDLLTHLSQLGTIKVISRTSVMGYEGSALSVPEIAQELGATTVLEGGIQRSGDRIRMNVQLIDARTDEHLWAEQYDRTLTAADVFAIQAEIAERIAASLATALTPEEKADLAAAPTENLEALDAYYRGLAFYRDREVPGYSERAEASLAAAVAADPEFAAAWAALAQARSWLLRIGQPQDPAEVREALDRAKALAPESRETALAEGVYLYYAKADFTGAAERYRQILSAWPEDAEALGGYSLVLRRLGQWREALEAGQRARELDPRNVENLTDLGSTLKVVRRYDEAERVLEEAIALNPDYLAPRFSQLGLSLSKGDTARARRLAAGLAGRPSSQLMAVITGQVAIWSRDYEAGIAALRNQADIPSNPGLRTLILAELYRMAGQERESRAYADSARMEVEQAMERPPADSLDPFAQRARYLAKRGQALAYLGRSAEAVRDVGHAMAMMPVSRDPLDAASILDRAATAFIVAGDHDAAFRTLDRLASIPSDLSVASLRLLPLYDPLRDDPRYPALLAKLEDAERTGTGTL